MKYKIISETEKSFKVEFEDCKHIMYINKKHMEDEQFCCNTCSNIWEDEYCYKHWLGLVKRSDVEQYKNEPKTKATDETKTKKKRKSKKQYIYEKRVRSVKNNFGCYVDTDVPFKVVNRTYYDINDLRNLSCIYSIHNTVRNERYIGSTRDLRARIVQHHGCLNRGDHHSKKLNNMYKVYKDPSVFEFEILEIVDHDVSDDSLHITEQKYIDLADSFNRGYNANPVAGFLGSYKEYMEIKKSIID